MEVQKTPLVEYPFYIKAAAVLLALVLTVYILHVLSGVFIPLAFSVLIAILLNPLYTIFERRMNKMFAILLSLLLATLVIAVLLYFLSTQISVFVESIPAFKVKITLLLQELQTWTKGHFGINIDNQVKTLTDSLHGAGGGNFITNTLGTILGLISVFLLIPVYVGMMLWYKPLILDFLFQVFSEQNSLRVAEILSQTKTAVQSFMQGLMLETLVVCAMNSVALMLIGVPSPIVLGVVGGLLNILPYIGGIIAIALPLLMLTITRDTYSGHIAVVASYLFIQFIDNNILVPRIVSSKVQINALMSIVVVLLGGALWGISGMFLSIPLIGVLKIVFDRVEGMKPWGKLLGDEVPVEHSGIAWQKRWDRIFRRMQQKKEMEEALAQSNAEEGSAGSEPIAPTGSETK